MEESVSTWITVDHVMYHLHVQHVESVDIQTVWRGGLFKYGMSLINPNIGSQICTMWSCHILVTNTVLVWNGVENSVQVLQNRQCDGGLYAATAFLSGLWLDSVRLWVIRTENFQSCRCCNFLLSFHCLSRHFWSDLSVQWTFLTDFWETSNGLTANQQPVH